MTKKKAKTGTPTMGRYTFRSQFERTGAVFMKDHGVKFEYEDHAIPYKIPAKNRNYWCDFRLKVNGKFFEFKGRFVAVDRAKMLYVKEQNPDLDITLVLMRPNNTISKVSQTTYRDWCDKAGLKWITYPDFQDYIQKLGKGEVT